MQVDKNDFEKYVWPQLKKIINKGWDKCEPDHLQLLIASLKFKVFLSFQGYYCYHNYMFFFNLTYVWLLEHDITSIPT